MCVALVASQAACLGTIVESSARAQVMPSRATLRWHLITAPRNVEAAECKAGMSDVFTYVPLWGVAIGILSLGIVVPQWTLYSCAAGN
jgi:hypothetical protein